MSPLERGLLSLNSSSTFGSMAERERFSQPRVVLYCARASVAFNFLLIWGLVVSEYGSRSVSRKGEAYLAQFSSLQNSIGHDFWLLLLPRRRHIQSGCSPPETQCAGPTEGERAWKEKVDRLYRARKRSASKVSNVEIRRFEGLVD